MPKSEAQIRREVCQEIRKKAFEGVLFLTYHNKTWMPRQTLRDVLREVESGSTAQTSSEGSS